MDEEPANKAVEKEEHIYLDVIHVASRPQSLKKSLCSKANESLQKTAVKNVIDNKKSKTSGNVANCVLISAIILLSVVCCTLGVLYVIEKRQSAMLRSEQRKGITSPTLSRNCSPSVNSVADENLDCSVLGSELEKKKSVYTKKCFKRQGEVEVDNQERTAKDCTEKSLLFRSSSDTITSASSLEMAAATVCFWCKSSPGVLHHVKYIEPNGGEGFEIVEERSSIPSTKWHSFCWAWSTGEEFYKLYKDGKLLRHREINRERLMTGGGSWELGIRSDIGAQTKMYGEMTSFNVWNRVLHQNEFTEIMATCVSKHKGNVKSWQELKSQVQGNVRLIESTCCKT